jgi:hypothetical protein
MQIRQRTQLPGMTLAVMLALVVTHGLMLGPEARAQDDKDVLEGTWLNTVKIVNCDDGSARAIPPIAPSSACTVLTAVGVSSESLKSKPIQALSTEAIRIHLRLNRINPSYPRRLGGSDSRTGGTWPPRGGLGLSGGGAGREKGFWKSYTPNRGVSGPLWSFGSREDAWPGSTKPNSTGTNNSIVRR